MYFLFGSRSRTFHESLSRSGFDLQIPHSIPKISRAQSPSVIFELNDRLSLSLHYSPPSLQHARPVALSSLIKSANYRALTMCSSSGGSYLFLWIPHDQKHHVGMRQLSLHRGGNYPVGRAQFGQLSRRSLYRDRLKGWYVVARNFFLLLLNCSARPCLAVA